MYYHVALPLLPMDPAVGEKWLTVAERKYPNTFRIGTMRTIALSMRGKTAAALDLARRLLDREPTNVEAMQLFADVSLLAHAPVAERANSALFGTNLEPAFANYWIFPESARARYAYLHLQRDDVAGARQLLDDAEQAALRLWKQGLETPLLPVELAAIRALRKDHAGAMEWLNRAYDSGWRMPSWIRLDPLLENLHSDTRFTQFVGRMEDDVRRAREHSTEVPELLRSLEGAAVQ